MEQLVTKSINDIRMYKNLYYTKYALNLNFYKKISIYCT